MNEHLLTEESTLLEALKKYFGFDRFRGEQEPVIRNIMAGRNTFVIMPTGAGKSLCYQLPAVMQEGTALVISPLIALMKNQVDQMRAFGIEAGFLNSTMARAEYEAVKQKVLKGTLKMLYVAPESLVKDEFVDFLKQAKVSFLAVDEAHCISEWGHDFRPEYRRIKEILIQLGSVPVIALTATATPKVRLDILQNLGMEEADVYTTSFNRPNLYYEFRPKVNGSNAISEIIKFIKQHSGRSGIIYCLSRRKVEENAELLNVNGIKAVPYHAGLDPATRNRHQDMFLNEDVQVVVATIAFGMGIDKPDVRFVFHFDVPKSIESWYQETGRAGRDGLEGNCILFYDFNDIVKLEKFMKDKPVSERESGRLLLYEMAAFAESGTCRRKMMLHYFGEKFNQEDCKCMCDNCRFPKETYDAKKHVALALEAVKQTRDKAQMTHAIQILRGINSQQVNLAEHDRLPVFGQGIEEEESVWKSVFSQLIIRDYIVKDINEYGVIKLGPKGIDFLNSPRSIELVKYKEIDQTKRDAFALEDFKTYDTELFEKLKALTRKVAKQKNIPPYVIFQDPSLEDMATKYPVSMAEFQNISGVGMGKAQKFAAPFIQLIKEYVEVNNIERVSEDVVKSAPRKSMNKLFVIQHVDRRTPLDEIATLKGIEFEELLDLLDQIVYSGTRLNLDYYLNDRLDEDKLDEVYDYFMQAETDDLDTAEKELDDDITRQEIRMVRLKFISEVGN